jgi:L-iditol 2-dehydrogenase
MKALVKTAKGPGFVEVREVGVPKVPAPDWVLIKVKAAGICGTDLHIWHDQFPYWPPVVLGHEFAGVIAETGAAVKGWKAGDRVVAEPHSLACGECDVCRRGQIQLCKSKRSPGWGIDGAFTDYLVMPASLLHEIPPGVPDVVAAIAEPMAIVIHQVLERGRVEMGDFVVVSGAGPVGILAAFLAKKAGARTVLVTGIGRSEQVRFPVSLKMGADECLNVEKQDVAARVAELTGGKGADLVVEASGNPRAIAQAFELSRIGGRISAIGFTGGAAVPVPWDTALLKVLDVSFNMSSSRTAWPRAMAALGSFHEALAPYVTSVIGLEEWEDAFVRLEAEKEVKTVFKF